MNKLAMSIIGVPMDFGQSRRGVDMGPSAMRYAGAIQRLEALGHEVKDEGDITVEKFNTEDQMNTNLRNLREVIESSTKLADKVSEVVAAKRFPLVLGGRPQYRNRNACGSIEKL